MSPQGTLGYPVKVKFEATDSAALRVGMRGTGKLYGDSVSLFYYLFRRPISAFRQTTGW